MESSFESVDIGGLQIPLYPTLPNYCVGSFASLSQHIADLPALAAEWEKIDLLLQDSDYMRFLIDLCQEPRTIVERYLLDFQEDQRFRSEMSNKLQLLAQMPHSGDLRFHALTLYVAVRCRRPSNVIETGVAQGKSTAAILLALAHNGFGRLISIDLAPNGDSIDGSSTVLHGDEIGWLVPEYLQDRWRLEIGNSADVLPKILGGFSHTERVQVFVHDSLHTEEHAWSELQHAIGSADPAGLLVLVDNIDMGCGRAFHNFLSSRGVTGCAYRDFGGAWV